MVMASAGGVEVERVGPVSSHHMLFHLQPTKLPLSHLVWNQ